MNSASTLGASTPLANAFAFIPPEVLSNIFNRVDFIDIVHLWLTGNADLRDRLSTRGALTRITMNVWQSGSNAWPSLLRKFTRLIEIEFTGVSALDDVPFAESFELLPPTVTSLTFGSSTGGDSFPAWWAAANAQAPSPLPNLRSLDLQGSYRLEHSDLQLCLLENLTFLALSRNADLQQDQLRHLPASLTHLKCHVLLLHEENVTPCRLELPELRRWDVTVRNITTDSLCPYLPLGLEHLYLHSPNGFMRADAELLQPLPLNFFKLDVKFIQADSIALLPPSLRELIISSSKPIPYTIINTVPRSLTTLLFHATLASPSECEGSTTSPFASMSETPLFDASTSPEIKFPPLLTSLYPNRISCPMENVPVGLRSLVLDQGSRIDYESVLSLPRALTGLEMPEIRDEALAALPHSLVILRATAGALSTSVVASDMPRQLTQLSLDNLTEVPNLSAFRGLKHLMELRIFAPKHVLPSIELSTLPPHLTSLFLRVQSLDYSMYDGDKNAWIKALPSAHMTTLELATTDNENNYSGSLSGALLRHLPLGLHICTLEGVDTLSDEHMMTLPPKLAYLRILRAKSTSVSNASVAHWSRTLSSVDLPFKSLVTEECIPSLPPNLHSFMFEGVDPQWFLNHLYGFDTANYCEPDLDDDGREWL